MFEWYGQGKTGQLFVATSIIEDLSGSKIKQDEEKGEYLKAGGSIAGPIKVVGHWDFDRVLEGYLRQATPEAAERLRSELEKDFREEEAAGEIIYDFTEEILESE